MVTTLAVRGASNHAAGESITFQNFKFGVHKEWLIENKHRAVPIFISGGECAGVNDYFAAAAAALTERDLIPLMVRNGIDGLIKGDFHNHVAIVTDDIQVLLRGQGGAFAGSSRVNLSKQNKEDIRQALDNLSGFKAILPIGGGDHAVFWTTFATDIIKRAGAEGGFSSGDLETLSAKIAEINERIIVVYKTIDGDVFGQPLGLRTAMEMGQKLIYGSHLSGNAMGKVTVIGSMGASVGRLPILAASRDPINLPLLEASRKSDDQALARAIRQYGNSVIVLASEYPVPLKTVVDTVADIKKTYGTATVVVSEGFKIFEDDEYLKKLTTAGDVHHDERANLAWERFTEANSGSRDPHGNVKWAQTCQEIIVEAAIRKFLPNEKSSTFRSDGKIGFGVRGALPGFYDRMYATLLGETVVKLIEQQRFGVAVSLPPDDTTIDRELIEAIQRRAKDITRTVYSKLTRKSPLRIQSFDEVARLKEEHGLYDARLAWTKGQLGLMGVLT